mgnify:CR=1 FL=1
MSNKFVLNESKMEVIHIHSKHCNIINTLLQIVVNIATIDLTSDARNLGVVFDDNLHFQKQINTFCSLAYLARNSVGHNSTVKLPRNLFTLLYRLALTTATVSFTGFQTFSFTNSSVFRAVLRD